MKSVLALLAILSITWMDSAGAEEPLKLRVGALAPRGTGWYNSLLELGEKWRAAEGAGTQYVVYGGGSQGSEADMVRRMRVGQLNGAMLTAVGLTEIDDSVAALQKMPLVFRSWDELDYVRDKLRPELDKRFFDKGFVVLAWGDAGWVRFFSKKAALHPADYRGMKIFTWAGDPPQAELMRSLGYQPVVLESADILPGLQTDMISMVPSTPFWALTLQFNRYASHMLDLDWAPLVGAVVITRKIWDAMSPAGRAALRTASEKMGVELRTLSRRQHREAIAAMTDKGLQVQTLSPEVAAEWRRTAEELYPLIRGKLVPAELFDEVQSLLREYRATRP